MTSYSVGQLIVTGGDVQWAGAATRVAKNLGVAPRADVKAIVDDANAETAVLRNQVIGTQRSDIKRDLTRLHESAMGNMVADAMRLKYPGVDAAYTNSGGLRADLNCTPPSAGEQPGEITWGEMFAVLPFGNRTVIFTLTGAQLQAGLPERLLTGLQPGDRYWTLPADLGSEGDLRLQWHHSGGDRACGRPRRASTARRHPSARPTRCGS